jgi:hypothetical protein
MDIESDDLILEILDAIEDCQNGDFESFEIIKDYLSQFEDVVKIELSRAGVTEMDLEEWETGYCEHLDEVTDCDFSDIHPDETAEDFWEHED